jgi:drug/metabolite transporter (DMT)-like permease
MVMKGRVIALIACMFLALEAVFTKVLTDYITPLALASFTSLITVVIIVFVLEYKHKVCEVVNLTRNEAFLLLAIGVVAGVGGQVFFITGIMYSGAATGVLLSRTNSLLMALGGFLFFREKFRITQFIGAAIMGAGIVILATKNFTVTLNPAWGDLLIIAAGACWACSNLIMKKYLGQMPPEVIVIGRNIVAAIALTLFMFVIGIEPLSLQAIPYVAGYVVLVIILGQYLWYSALEHTTASNVAIVSLSMPILGVFYAVSLLGESLTDYQLTGGILIFAGLVAIEIFTKEDSKIKEHMMRSSHPKTRHQ